MRASERDASKVNGRVVDQPATPSNLHICLPAPGQNMAERSLTGGLSLLELKRQREKLDKVIVQEEENVAKHKALRERDRVKQHGKVLVPPSPVKDKRESLTTFQPVGPDCENEVCHRRNGDEKRPES